MMPRLLVDTIRGVQEVVEIAADGGYHDASLVLWDERSDGPLPSIQVGAMVRQNGDLVADAGRKAQHDAALVTVPAEVTMRQARQALILAGLDDEVEALLAALQGQQGKLARAEWEQSQTVQRNRPLVQQVWAQLGKTPDELDALFIAASKLP